MAIQHMLFNHRLHQSTVFQMAQTGLFGRKKMQDLLNKLTKSFLLKEGHRPDFKASVQALDEIISNWRPRTKRERNRLDLAREQLYNIKGHFRKVNKQLQELQERLNVLEEEKKEVK